MSHQRRVFLLFHLCRRLKFVIFLLILLNGLALVRQQVVFAEGSQNLYPTDATCGPNPAGSCRASLEWRTNTYGTILVRRTLLRVYARANEYILIGSSAIGVNLGDGLIYPPNQISGQKGRETLGTPSFQCSIDGRAANPGLPTMGQITSRAEELTGPDTIPASVANAYVPCFFQAPADGIYGVEFLGTTGDGQNVDGGPTADITMASAANFDATQGSSVSAWDVTVRTSLTNAATRQNGRVFTYTLALFTGGNAEPVKSSVVAVTTDGFQYAVDLGGMDPNGFMVYGSQQGILDTNGSPLYHDAVADTTQPNPFTLNAVLGNVSFSPPDYPLFFQTPDPQVLSDTVNGLGIPAPVLPTVSAYSFTGNVSANISNVGVGGTFQYTSNVGGIYQIVLSRDTNCATANYDPSNPLNRVLRGQRNAGANTVTWDGQDNSGNPFPVGGPYCTTMSLHAGEYHFPLFDAESSTLGGPHFRLTNPPGGVCPPLTGGCSGAFYDDRGYQTAGGVIVAPPTNTVINTVLCGVNPPTIPNSDPFLGFDSSTAQRAFGVDTNTNLNDPCLGPFGDAKGLDTWTYYPSVPTSATVIIINAASTVNLSVTKTSDRPGYIVGDSVTYTIVIANSGPASVTGATVNDTVPSQVTNVSWTCVGNGTDSCGAVTSGTGNSISFIAGAFNTGANDNLTITVTGTATTTGTAIPNTVTVAVPPTITNIGNTSATATINITTTVPPATTVSSNPTGVPGTTFADPRISKQSNVTLAQPGDTVSFVITVTNVGTAPATSVIVTDPIPNLLIFVSANTSQGTYKASGNLVTFDVGTVNPGQVITLTLVTRVSPNAQPPVDITNTATLTDAQGHVRSSSATLRITRGVLPNTGEHPDDTPIPWWPIALIVAVGFTAVVSIAVRRRWPAR